MFYASVHIDLPSEELLRRKTALEWLAGLIGRTPSLASGEELSTATGLALLERIVAALARVEITDVLSMTVDRKLAYVDTEQNSGDLAAAIAELDARGVIEAEFESMQLVLSHHGDGLHTLVEIRLRRRVPVASPELELAFAGRLEATQVRRGEGPGQFAERLRALDPDAIRAARDRFAARVDSLRSALADELGELARSTAQSPVAVRLIRPGPRALDQLRRLPWGAAVRAPTYRPVPVRQRRGAYDEPFYHHFFDPYFDFVAWVLLAELVAGRGWSGVELDVVDEAGQRLFGSADARGQAAVSGEFPPDVVRIVDDRVIVDAAVPELGAREASADPRAIVGYGGDGRIDEGAVGADWNESGDPGGPGGGDLGGSCGASCGGCGGA